jgi:hypothetical protein
VRFPIRINRARIEDPDTQAQKAAIERPFAIWSDRDPANYVEVPELVAKAANNAYLREQKRRKANLGRKA